MNSLQSIKHKYNRPVEPHLPTECPSASFKRPNQIACDPTAIKVSILLLNTLSVYETFVGFGRIEA